jgi:hypothetical protein
MKVARKAGGDVFGRSARSGGTAQKERQAAKNETTYHLDSPAERRNPVRSGLPMARKKISTTIYITPEQNDLLKVLNQRTKVPIAEYIRQGIDLVLEKYKGRLPGQANFDELSSGRLPD